MAVPGCLAPTNISVGSIEAFSRQPPLTAPQLPISMIKGDWRHFRGSERNRLKTKRKFFEMGQDWGEAISRQASAFSRRATPVTGLVMAGFSGRARRERGC